MGKKLKHPQTKDQKHPVQPIGFDAQGTVRFKRNEIVRFLLDACACGYKFDLNDLVIQMQVGGDRFPPGPLHRRLSGRYGMSKPTQASPVFGCGGGAAEGSMILRNARKSSTSLPSTSS